MEGDGILTTSHAVTECRNDRLHAFKYEAFRGFECFLSFFHISFGYRCITLRNTL